MENKNSKLISRKKFVAWGAGILSVFTTAGIFFSSKKSQKSKTVKMLTQEGKLVEVDIASLPAKRKKISNKELQNWIK